jgi:hypothetical protein
MNNVIIVSKCLRVTNFTFNKKKYVFHFRGVYVGKKIRKVELVGDDSLNILKGEEYVLYVKIVSIDKDIVRGTIIKFRDIEELKDQS